MKANWVVLAATVAGADAQFFWGSSGSGLHERRTKDTQPVLNVGALNGTLQHMLSDVNGLKTGLQAAATSVANLEAKVKPPPPPVPGGMAAFHAIVSNNADSQTDLQAQVQTNVQAGAFADSQADAQAEAEASARAEAVARAEEAQEAKEVSEVVEVDPQPPVQKPRLSQAVSAKRERQDTRMQGRAKEEGQGDAEDNEEAGQADDVTEQDHDTAHGSDDDDDWDRGWSKQGAREAPDEDEEEDVVVMQHHKRHGSSEVGSEFADTDAVREASSMAVVHRHGSHSQQGTSRQLRGASRKAEAKTEAEMQSGDEDERSTEETEDRSEEEDRGEEYDESGEWAWSDADKPNAERL